MKEKTIYNLTLHETLEIKGTMGGKIEVTRVPGGFVYSFDYPGYRQAPIIFVPYNEEFIKKMTKIKK